MKKIHAKQHWLDIRLKYPSANMGMAGKNEKEIAKLLKDLARENVDYVRQYLFYDEENNFKLFVDFCFPHQKIIIEIDGPTHLHRRQIIKDIERDAMFTKEGYLTIRIKTPLSPDQLLYWKVYIEELIK